MTHILLNKQVANSALSATLLINEEVERRRVGGQSVLHMGFGESRFAVHPKIAQALANNAGKKSYEAAQGLLDLRQAVAGYYGKALSLEIAPHQVIIGPGSKALIYAIQLAVNADLILPAPTWVSYAPQAKLVNKEVAFLFNSSSHGYRWDLQDLDRHLKGSKGNRKLLLINSPNNPSGEMLDESFLRDLAGYCRDQDILVVSDEIYGFVAHGKVPHHSIAKYYSEGTVVLAGLSKHLSLGGWRLGHAIVPDTVAGHALMSALCDIASETWSAVSSPVQYAAITAYSEDREIERYISACTQIHGMRTRFVCRHLRALGINCSEPQGGFYLIANFDPWRAALRRIGIGDSNQLATMLMEQYGLASLAGESFGIPAEHLSLRLATSFLDMESEEDSRRLHGLYEAEVAEEVFMSALHHPRMHAAIGVFVELVGALNKSSS